jgi:multiple sugar transport system permease protein
VAAPFTQPRGAQVAAQPLAAKPWFKSSQRILGRDWPVAYVFVLPTVLLLFGLVGYPFARGLALSFFNAVGIRTGAFVGLDNYQALWADDFFIRAVWTTAQFTFWSVVAKFILGISTALLLHNIPKWGSVLGGLILLPFIIPEVVRALAWRVLLDPIFGALNYMLVKVFHVLPVGIAWLGEQNTALPSVIMVNVWAGLPFFIILCTAGLKAVDAEQYDAAAVDGATPWRRFLHVTLPGMRYVIIVATLLSTILTFNNFGLTYLLTGGGPGGATRVYTILAYEYAITGLRYGSGAAVAMTTAPVMFLLILFLGRYMMQRSDVASSSDDDGFLSRVGNAVLAPFRQKYVGWVLGHVLLNLALLGIWWLRGDGSVSLTQVIILNLAVALLFNFWAIHDAIESLFVAAARAVRPPGSPAMFSRNTGRGINYTILYILLGAVLIFELLPFYFIVVTAFKSTLQIQQIQNMFWPSPWTFEHFRFMIYEKPFLTWYRNTIVVAVVSTTISVLAAALGGYALARLKWRGAGAMSTTVLIAYLMPPALLMIPLYYILVQLKLTNTLMALMVTYPSAILPFATWLMMGYYRSIPEELEDAAMIDGCSRFGAFFRVVLPLVRPALLAVTMFAITNAWNEFLYAFSFLRSSENFTLSVGLQGMIIGDVQPWGELMASCLMTALPVVIIYMLGQRFMVAGLTAGSVKG